MTVSPGFFLWSLWNGGVIGSDFVVGYVVIGAGDFCEDDVGRAGNRGDCADQLDVLLVDVRDDVGENFGEFGGGDVGVLSLIRGVLEVGLVTDTIQAASTFRALNTGEAAVDGGRVCIELPETDWAGFCEGHSFLLPVPGFSAVLLSSY